MVKYVPKSLAPTIYDIDFNKLYEKGVKYILFDLDNTLAPYDDIKPTPKQIEFNQKLREKGFKIFILSNNNKKRMKLYTEEFIVDAYLSFANKPLSFRIKRFLKKHQIDKSKSIWIGDQLLTDISCANKIGIDSILVSSISRKSEKWYTRWNRKREEKILKKIALTDPLMAQKIKDIISKKGEQHE